MNLIEGGGDLVDNGISQTVTVNAGAATLTKAEVPSPAELRPYRTFLEVEQPSRPFVFRIDKNGDCALFEADGGIWKHAAKDTKLNKEIFLGHIIEASWGINYGDGYKPGSVYIGTVEFGEHEQDASGGEYSGASCVGFYG